MRIFLDSSKISEAEKWMPILDGATTNPSILLKEGGNIYEFCKYMYPKPVSVEACGSVELEAIKYSEQIPNAVIKITLLNMDGSNNLALISKLARQSIKINCTALFSLSQVILAAKAGARYVSLFAGRIDDEGGDYYGMVRDSVSYLDSSGLDVELIVGSVRTVGMVLDSASANAHVVTIPPEVLNKMVMHRFSLDTVKQFELDQEKIRLG